jgi:hypothetical protein
LMHPGGTSPKASSSRPMPLIPVAEMEEIVADADDQAFAATIYGGREHDPVSSDYFDDLEVTVGKR